MMAFPTKKDSPALKKREEALHRDLDGDQERGENASHRQKVLRSGAKGGKVCPTCGKSPCRCKK